MRKGIRSILADFKLEYNVVGVGSFFHIDWTKEQIINYRTSATEDRNTSRLFSTEMMNRGVFMWGHPNVSTVTTNNDVNIALEAVRRSLDNMYKAK